MENAHNSQSVFSPNSPTTGAIRHKSRTLPLVLIIINSFATLLVTIFGIILPLINDATHTSRTIMLYMAGSDLESTSGLASADLESINYADAAKNNVQVVAIIGGSKHWYNNYISDDETSYYELTDSGFEKVKQNPRLDMGEPETLSDFLTYAYQNYPSEEYELVFWNHGGAIDGSEYDELSLDNNLSLTDFESALSSSPFNSNNKLENIIFRTCLNGTLEVADIFDDFSDRLVASEEVTVGATNSSTLNFINNLAETDSGYDIGHKYIDAYRTQVDEIRSNYGETSDIYSTYSIIDLSKINDLTSNLNHFASAINSSANYNQISKVRANLYQYGATQGEASYYDTIDLYNFIDQLKSLAPSEAESLLSTLDSAVEYNYATNSNSRGLSIYFPYNGETKYQNYFLDIYGDIASLPDYYNLITTFSGQKSSTSQPYDFSATTFAKDSSSANSTTFKTTLTDDQLSNLAQARFIVFEKSDRADGAYIPRYSSDDVSIEGNNISATIDKRLINIYDHTDNTSINDLTLIRTSEDDNYIYYKTYVVLDSIASAESLGVCFNTEDKNTGESNLPHITSAELGLALNKNTNEVTVSHLLTRPKDTENDNYIVASTLSNHRDMSIVSSHYYILDDRGNFRDDWLDHKTPSLYGWEFWNGKSGDYTAKDLDKVISFEVEDIKPDTEYVAVFRLYDTNGNFTYTNIVNLTKGA